jgi:hypothetical protein
MTYSTSANVALSGLRAVDERDARHMVIRCLNA